MKSRNIRIINSLLFLVCVFITFYVVFKKNDVSLIFSNISKVNYLFVLLAILCVFAYISGEGINIRRVLLTFGYDISFFKAFKYAAVGFFFSSITPSATGGDPAQLYFMSKDKLPISHSALFNS